MIGATLPRAAPEPGAGTIVRHLTRGSTHGLGVSLSRDARRARPVVWISHKDAKCNSCGAGLGRGKLIVIDRAQGIRCLECASLAGLEFLPSGDAALIRRALARSSPSAVVVKFSRARKRNERQGVLVEETATHRRILEQLLRSWNIQVDPATSSAEALTLLRQAAPVLGVSTLDRDGNRGKRQESGGDCAPQISKHHGLPPLGIR